MKAGLMTAALACALVWTAAPARAADAAKDKPAAADAEAEVKTGPTEAQKAKARKQKKPVYTKAAEALKAAEQCDQPLMAFLLKDDPVSQMLEKKLLSWKPFKDDLAKSSLVLLKLKVKTDMKGTAKVKKIDVKPLKEAERKVFENFGTDEKEVARAKRENKDEPQFDWASNYPAVIFISPDGTKQLARLPKYDSEGGPGVWITTVIDLLRTAGIEPPMSKTLEKITENPTEPKKWK